MASDTAAQRLGTTLRNLREGHGLGVAEAAADAGLTASESEGIASGSVLPGAAWLRRVPWWPCSVGRTSLHTVT